MDRYICVHCHFYQPPRENPWLEAVELQDSAYPYHDWNERITAECYAPNSASRILEPDGRIAKIVNNYANISFNFGPTLLSWMQEEAPGTYERVLQADRDSRERFGGHGSAVSQVYNHMILPLANQADKQTQVIWGIRDFEHRFGRKPEGMWLAESAVNTETLEVLAEHGIKYTILAPHQAKAVRSTRAHGVWKNVEGGKIDPTRAYLCNLPSGRSISLFFYDGPISQAVAFEKLLSSGETFARRLLGGFSDTRKWNQLMHIATDGETYGHHHPHGDMALAYALDYIDSTKLAKITNYGEFLEKDPPQVEVQIVENTSWSCAHGVERWRADCGCSGGRAGWNQQWRGPLRAALDWLRDAIAAPYEEKARALFKDPVRARNEYVNVILDRSPENVDVFFAAQATHALSQRERTTALKLMEMQRHAMLMYTSCGWFFEELSGIETVQVIFYAGRVLQLAKDVLGQNFELGFLDRLAQAQSNIRVSGTGADIYRRWVKPGVVTLLGVGAHYAISSMFEAYADNNSIYCYDVDLTAHRRESTGRARMSVGHAIVRSRVTEEEQEVTFGAVHLGDHNVSAGVRAYGGDGSYGELESDLSASFLAADLPAAVFALGRHFDTTYSLKSLFRDEQRKVTDEIMELVLAEADGMYRHIYEAHAPLMRFLSEMNIPQPDILRITSQFVLNTALRRELRVYDPDADRIRDLLETVAREKVELDKPLLSFTMKKRLDSIARTLSERRSELPVLRKTQELVELALSMPFEVDLWRVQNVFNDIMHDLPRADDFPDAAAYAEWLRIMDELGRKLRLNVENFRPVEEAAA